MIIDENICPVTAHVGFSENKHESCFVQSVCMHYMLQYICYSMCLQEVIKQFARMLLEEFENSGFVN